MTEIAGRTLEEIEAIDGDRENKAYLWHLCRALVAEVRRQRLLIDGYRHEVADLHEIRDFIRSSVNDEYYIDGTQRAGIWEEWKSLVDKVRDRGAP